MASHFSHKAPRNYAYKVEEWLGEPSIEGNDVVGWEKSANSILADSPYDRIEIKDEYVPHNFPAEHHDFVYSYAKIRLTPSQACSLLKVSGSILPDLLKKEVGARCGDLTANDVTLSFVQDVADGLTEPTKQEYSRRIKNSIVTRRKFNAHKKVDKEEGKEEYDECILF